MVQYSVFVLTIFLGLLSAEMSVQHSPESDMQSQVAADISSFQHHEHSLAVIEAEDSAIQLHRRKRSTSHQSHNIINSLHSSDTNHWITASPEYTNISIISTQPHEISNSDLFSQVGFPKPLSSFSNLTTSGSDVPKSRRRRAVINWPRGARFAADYSMTVPLRTPLGITMPFTVDMAMYMPLPNVDLLGLTGRSIEDDRLQIFGLVENFFARVGIDGRECIMLALCERAEANLLTNGMFGYLITALLEVSSGISGDDIAPYRDADYYGRHHGGCIFKYPECPMSFFKWID